jgi:hypothetical protein
MHSIFITTIDASSHYIFYSNLMHVHYFNTGLFLSYADTICLFFSEFAEAQMTIRDIKTDLVTSRVPYIDYQSYAFHQLFPNQKMETHPLLHEPMVGP